MTYVTVQAVKDAIDFPTVGAPLTDDQILANIISAEQEIEEIYHTKFGNVEVSSVATSGTLSTIVDTTKTYTTDQFVGYVVWVYAGTNEGEYREVIGNNATTLIVGEPFPSAIDNTSYFRITKLGYMDEKVDGSGVRYQFTRMQPLIKLNYLEIDNVVNNVDEVFIYKDTGRLLLSGNSNSSYFSKARPQQVRMKYIYGVYPIPEIIKRLCVLIAAIRTTTAQVAGTYDKFATVSLPGGLSGSKGQPYVNIQSAVTNLQQEARGIVYGNPTGQASNDLRSLPSYRPFTLFG
jgi:hypothetical protein